MSAQSDALQASITAAARMREAAAETGAQVAAERERALADQHAAQALQPPATS